MFTACMMSRKSSSLACDNMMQTKNAERHVEPAASA